MDIRFNEETSRVSCTTCAKVGVACVESFFIERIVVNLSDGSEILPVVLTEKECGEDASEVCGSCGLCRRRAAVSVASHVLDSRFTERGRSYDRSGPEERRYAKNRVRMLLDMLGLSEDPHGVTLDDVRLSEWGRAMREIQLAGAEDGGSSQVRGE